MQSRETLQHRQLSISHRSRFPNKCPGAAGCECRPRGAFVGAPSGILHRSRSNSGIRCLFYVYSRGNRGIQTGKMKCPERSGARNDNVSSTAQAVCFSDGK